MLTKSVQAQYASRKITTKWICQSNNQKGFCRADQLLFLDMIASLLKFGLRVFKSLSHFSVHRHCYMLSYLSDPQSLPKPWLIVCQCINYKKVQSSALLYKPLIITHNNITLFIFIFKTFIPFQTNTLWKTNKSPLCHKTIGYKQN